MYGYPCAFFTAAGRAKRGIHLEVAADEELASHAGQWCVWYELVGNGYYGRIVKVQRSRMLLQE